MDTRPPALRAYDEQLRGASGFGQGVIDSDGPLTRLTGGHRGFVSAPWNLGPGGCGLDSSEVDDLISRTVAHFRAAGQSFEWKTRGHDLPTDLPARLQRAGFVPEPVETVMIGDALAVPNPVPVPGIRVRSTTDPADLARIAQLHTFVWGSDCSWLAAELAGRIARGEAPGGPQITVLVAEDARSGVLACAAWLECDGRDFAGLWGGSTLAPYRRRGIYRNLVAHRAEIARRMGRRYLQVDASADSAPILARLGLQPATTTTPYVWEFQPQ